MEHILRTFNLTKTYDGKNAVDNVNINVKRGEIYGFLGQNGAGKTTSIRMIMGLIQPTSGSIELFGESFTSKNYEVFQRIGSIIEFPGFYPNLTGYENLDIHRKLMGVTKKSRIDEVLELTGILDAKNKKVKGYSLGMKQRLGIARSLLHYPEFLILDEPTNGLDPIGIKEIRNLILDLSHKRNITILVSSHILSEVQQIASKIGLIHEGKLLEEIDFAALEARNKNYIELRTNDDKKTTFLLEQKLGVMQFKTVEPGIIRVYEKLDQTAKINSALVKNDVDVYEIKIMRESLEDYFIKMVGSDINVQTN